MIAARLLVPLLFLLFSGCAMFVPDNGCIARGKPGFHEASPESLTLLVAWTDFAGDKPYLALDETGDRPGLRIDLEPISNGEALRLRCETAEVRAFALDASLTEWQKYWTVARERGTWSAGIGFPGLDEPPEISEYGFAFVNNDTGKASLTCGCLVN